MVRVGEIRDIGLPSDLTRMPRYKAYSGKTSVGQSASMPSCNQFSQVSCT